ESICISIRIFPLHCSPRFGRTCNTGSLCRGPVWWLFVLLRRSESATRAAAFYRVLPQQFFWSFRLIFWCICFSRSAKGTAFRPGWRRGRQTCFSPELACIYFICDRPTANRRAFTFSPGVVWYHDESASK